MRCSVLWAYKTWSRSFLLKDFLWERGWRIPLYLFIGFNTFNLDNCRMKPSSVTPLPSPSNSVKTTQPSPPRYSKSNETLTPMSSSRENWCPQCDQWQVSTAPCSITWYSTTWRNDKTSWDFWDFRILVKFFCTLKYRSRDHTLGNCFPKILSDSCTHVGLIWTCPLLLVIGYTYKNLSTNNIIYR